MPSTADIQTIRKRLNRFSCLQAAPILSEEELLEVRTALSTFNELSDYQTLGVCAKTLRDGKQALESFLKAHGVDVSLDLPEQDGPVYIKFNTLKGAWYLDNYGGPSRGVLVTYHATDAEAAEVSGTYGPFPLNLYP